MVVSSALWFVLLLGFQDAATKSMRRYVDDPTCPRKPALIDRTCEKKCRTDVNCRGRNRRCLCDDVCGRSCIRPNLKCPDVKLIFNGKYESTGSNTFNSRVRYTCNEGYILSGQPERVCQGNARWSGQAPTCETEGKCRDPPQVPHAAHDGPRGQGVFPLGTQLTYSCVEGFSIDGFFRAMCVGEGRWVGPRMTCSPRRCGHPGDIQNGRRHGNIFVFPKRITYSCTEGYEMIGRDVRVCRSSGEWSGTPPICKPVRCPRLTRPVNGYMHGSDFTYGAVVGFSCVPGFMLIGTQARTCRQDSRWSGEDGTCAMVDCGLPGEFYNGFLEGEHTTYNSTFFFRCYGRTTIEGISMSSTCQENGTWSHPVPTCWSNCEVPEVVNGTVIGYDVGHYLEHGTKIHLTCNQGYLPTTNAMVVCHNGTWKNMSKCAPAPCKDRPPGINDGFVRFYTTDHGARAKYKCSTGFELIGNMYVVCEYGRWRRHGDEEPYCNPVYCTYPGTILNGQILLVGIVGKFEYRPYVRSIGHTEQIEYHCGKAYKRVGPAGATCVDGAWSPSPKPQCVLKKHPKLMSIFRGKRSVQEEIMDHEDNKGLCEVPEVTNGHVTQLAVADYVAHGAALSIQCDGGHELIGSATSIRCQDGEWSAPAVCVAEYCPWPGGIEHGEVLVVGVLGKYHYRPFIKLRTNDRVEFLCAEGHYRVGQLRSTCYYGQWHPRDKPRCISADDNKLLYTTKDTTDEIRRVLLADDGDEAFCEIPRIANGGAANLPEGFYVPHNATMRVECELGYEVDENERDIARCVDGLWTHVPRCLPEILDLR